MNAWRAGYNSQSLNDITVVTGEEKQVPVLEANSNASGVATGKVSFLATDNGNVDITLLEPNSSEIIPGLTVDNGDDLSYRINDIPNGTFIIFASLKNDDYVLDPDSIVKFGLPKITISFDTVEKNFDVTDAVNITSPENNTRINLPANDSDLTFKWDPYPSASDYVVEVANASGEIIWGGFNKDGSKKISLTSNSTTFNFDGSASESLKSNTYYQLRVYASKNDVKEPLGFKLISSSEVLEGLFEINP